MYPQKINGKEYCYFLSDAPCGYQGASAEKIDTLERRKEYRACMK